MHAGGPYPPIVGGLRNWLVDRVLLQRSFGVSVLRPQSAINCRESELLRASDLEEPVRVAENLRRFEVVEQFACLPDREPKARHDPQLAVTRIVRDQPLPGLSCKATDES